MTKRQSRKHSASHRSGNTPVAPPQQRARYRSTPTTALTSEDVTTLRNVIGGYVRFLRTASGEDNMMETVIEKNKLAVLQTIFDRLPEHLNEGDMVYFSHEELKIVMAVLLKFHFTLTVMPNKTSMHKAGLYYVEQLLTRFFKSYTLPLQ